MKKKTIKLNEAQLRKMIAETINELDWKTYASAADKRRKQAEANRGGAHDWDKLIGANELDKAASRALSDKYGRNLHTYGNIFNGETGDREVADDKSWYGSRPTGYHYFSSKDRDWRDIDNQFQEGDFEEYGDIPFDRETDSELDKQNNEIGREVDHFTHGRYAYDKRKGWHLKESQLRKMIAESIKRVLRENENIASGFDTSSWKNSNDAQYQEAVDILSRHALDYIEPEDMIANPDLIEDDVRDCWQFELDGDVLDALYDRFDVAGVIGKNKYGGGSFEALRQLQMDVRDNVLNILQKNSN